MRLFVILLGLTFLAACSNSAETDATSTTQQDASATQQDADLRETLLPDYLERINSNDLDTVMAGFTDDVVFQAPHGPEVAGKAALREWIGGYLAAFDTQWVKTSQDMIVSGDYAIERYAYQSTDTSKADGAVHTDEGKGLIVYHKERDGVWRVTRDAWSTNLPMAAPDNGAKAIVEQVYASFAAGDMDKVTGAMAADIIWNEAEGNPYADNNPYLGPEAILTGLFARLGGEWDGFTAEPQEYVTQGDRVIVFGRYSGTYKATGQSMDAPFVHSWTVADGKIAAFQQYTDTAAQAAVMAQ